MLPGDWKELMQFSNLPNLLQEGIVSSERIVVSIVFVFLEKKASMSVYRNVEWVGESGIFAYNLDTILLQ